MSYFVTLDNTKHRKIKIMEDETKTIVAYSIRIPKPLKDYFQSIADKEERDLSFVIRKILIKEKQRIEQELNTNYEK